MPRHAPVQLRLLLAFIATACLLVAVPARAQQSVAIGLAAPLTGISERFGKSFLQASQVAIDQANQAGMSINGQRLSFTLVSADDRGDPRSARLAAQYLIKKDVVGVIGHGITAASLAAAPLYNEAGLPMITGSSSSKELTEQGYRNAFRTIGHDDTAAVHAANYVQQVLKGHRVAVVDDGSIFGMRLARQFAQAFSQAGGVVMSRHSVNDKTSDFNDMLYVVKGQQVDAVFFGGSVRQAAEIVRNMRRLGIAARFMTGSNGAADRQFLDTAGTAAEGALSIEPGIAFEKMPGWKAFAEAYFKRGDAEMSTFAPYVYDATQALIAAIRLADSVEPAKVAQALHRLQLHGLTGRIGFDEQGNLLEPAYTIYEVRRQHWSVQQVAGGRK